MQKSLIKHLLCFIILQFFILIIELLHYNEISILYYINISFYVSAALFLIALFVFVIQTGFFDVVKKAFTIAFSRAHENEKMGELRPLSKLVAINHKPLFFHGLLTGLCMGIALIFYYN